MRLWDCDVCESEGYDLKRGCFKECGNLLIYYQINGQYYHKEVDIDGLWEVIEEIYDNEPNSPSIYNLVGKIKAIVGGRPFKICPTSIVDPFIDRLVLYENLCNIYHVLPFTGGLLEQPQYLIDAFAVIRATQNQFDEYEAKLAELKSKTYGKNNK